MYSCLSFKKKTKISLRRLFSHFTLHSSCPSAVTCVIVSLRRIKLIYHTQSKNVLRTHTHTSESFAVNFARKRLYKRPQTNPSCFYRYCDSFFCTLHEKYPALSLLTPSTSCHLNCLCYALLPFPPLGYFLFLSLVSVSHSVPPFSGIICRLHLI